jgi:hypothetical protein
MRICFLNRHMLTIRSSISPKCSTILKTFKLSSLTCSQIWLNPLLPPTSQISKRKKRTGTWKLCRELRWRCWCCFWITYVHVARIRRHRPHTLGCTTSADIPLERLQHFT